MPNRRKKSIKGANQEDAARGLGRYRYVDLVKLERRGISQFKPEPEHNYIAVIPVNDEAHVDDEFLSMFCREIFVHTYIGVNNLTFLCLKQMSEHQEDPETSERVKWNEPCAVCEYIQKLRSTHPDSPLIKEMKASIRFLFFIVDVSRFEKGVTSEEMERARLKVQWWDATTAVRKGIVQASSDPRTGEPEYDVADPDEGQTVIFYRTTDKVYKCENFRVEGRQPIPYEWLDQVSFEFDDILKIPNYDDVKAEVEGIPAEAQSGGSTEGRGRRRRRSEPSDGAGSASADTKPADTETTKTEERGRRRRSESTPESTVDEKVTEETEETKATGRGSGGRSRRRSEPAPETQEPSNKSEPELGDHPDQGDNDETAPAGGSKIDEIRARIASRKG